MIKTKSFELAVTSQGNANSERLLLCLPGRLDTKDYAHMQSHLEYFSQRGYFGVSFDPPGTWESGGDISLYTTPNYLAAIHELIEHYGNRPTVVMGHSRGGTMAMLAGVSNEHVTHIVAVMSHWGPSGRPETDKNVHISKRDIPPGIERTVEQKVFELPMSYFDDPTDYSGLDTCTKPKLLFAGKDDVLIPPEYVQEVLAAAGEPKTYHELDSEHDYRLHQEIIDEVNQKTEAFLLDN